MMKIKQTVLTWSGNKVDLSKMVVKSSLSRSDYLGIDPKTWRALIKAGYEHIAELWHRKFLPKHFTKSGAAEYDYMTRTPDYQKRKRNPRKTFKRGALAGRDDPLVFSGDLAYQAQRGYRVSSTSKGGNVILDVPRYAYYRVPGTPYKIAELTTVSSKEIMWLTAQLDKFIDREANKVRPMRSPTQGLTA